MKRQITDWEYICKKTFANYISDKGLVSRIPEDRLQLANKKTNCPILKIERKYLDTSLKKMHGWQISTWKDVQHHSLLGKCKLKPHRDTTMCLLECLKLSLISCWWGCGATAVLIHCQWNVKWYKHFGKQFDSFFKSDAYIYHMTQQGRSKGKDYKEHKKTFVGVDLLIILFVVMADSCTLLSKLIKLWTLNTCSLLYVNYTFTSLG